MGGISTMEWVGLKNFKFLLSDPWFWGSLWNTFILLIISGLPQHIIAIPLAFILSIIISLIYIYAFPNPVYDIRLFPKRKKKIKEIYKSSDIKNEIHKENLNIQTSANSNNLGKDLAKRKEIQNLNNINYSNKGDMDNIF